ncbi:hypothetical protein [Streptomyces avicenniae]|uniref:hypothetical protein n=1 Tax=Streptomyces avicenniae TaxID=500153 RepID=UPI00069B825B|nr:hypothetical protein [Streptomyces avicenniae]
MSETEARAWSVSSLESVARTAGARIDPASVSDRLSDCTGRNGEQADDGRFFYRYSVLADVPPERRAEAVRAVRDDLEARGLDILGYRSDPAVSPANAVDTEHPEEHYSITVEDNGTSHLLLIFMTPCLLPPGVEQQQL